MDVTFVCANLFERPAKIAAALSSQGVYVDLLTSNSSIQPSWKKYFRNIGTVTTFEEFRQALDSLHGSTPIHHFSSGVDGFTVALLNLNKRFIFDYKDVFPEVLTLPSDNHSTILNEILERDLPIIYRDSQLDRYISKKRKAPPSFCMHVPDFIWSNLSPSMVRFGSDSIERRKRLTFVGNFSIESIEPNYAGLGQLPIIDSLVQQGFFFHMFPFRHDKRDEDPISMSDYLSLAKRQTGFILEGRLPLPHLQSKLKEMGWGTVLSPAYHFDSLKELHYMIEPFIGLGARYSDYIGAGLPIIVSDNFVEAKDMIESYGIGLSISKDELGELIKIVRECDYSLYRQNVLSFGSEILNPVKWAQTIKAYYNDIWY